MTTPRFYHISVLSSWW